MLASRADAQGAGSLGGSAAARCRRALAAVSALFSSGSSGGRLVWIGVAALAVATAVVVGAPGGLPRSSLLARRRWSRSASPRRSSPGTGSPVLWSIEGDRSWAYLNRGLVYLAPRGGRALARSVGAAVGVRAGRRAGAAARLGAAREGDPRRSARPDAWRWLSSPIGYWNALAVAVRDGAAARARGWRRGGSTGTGCARGGRGLRLRAGRRVDC